MMKGHFAYICTVGSSNHPHVTPVFFVYSWEDSSIYLITSSKSKKMTNIRSNRRVAITIDIRDPVDPQNNLGVLVRGKAEIIGSLTTAGKRDDWETRLHNSFEDKYKEFEKWLSDYRGRTGPASIVWVKIRPSKMTWWRLWRFKTLKFPRQA